METNNDSQFEEYKNKTINGKILTYKTSDVAKLIDEKDQTVRNYCGAFKEFLDTDHIEGEHRIFVQEDIDKFLFIKYLLKEKGYSTKQTKEYLSTPEGKALVPIEEIEEKDKMKLLAEMMTENLKPYVATVIENSIQKAIQNELRNIDNPIVNNQIELNNKINTILQTNIKEMSEVALSINSNIKTDREQLTESMIRVENKIQEFQDKANAKILIEPKTEKKGLFSWIKKK